MKLIYFFFISLVLLLAGCNHEPATTISSEESDTLNLPFADNETSNNIFEKEKWISLSEQSTESSDGFGYVPGRRKLEKRLEKEYSTIDPLEYYLSENDKFSDKEIMKKKREKIKSLNKIYNSNYYDLGHIPERRNNSNIMLSLTNTAYPLKSYALMSDDFTDNKNIVEIKSVSKKMHSPSADDLKTILNNAVQLINLSQLPEAEVTLNDLEGSAVSNEYLWAYNKAFIRFQYADFLETIRYSKKSIKLRKDFYLGYLLLGDAYLALDINGKAYQYYSDAIKIKENIVSLERVAYAAMLIGKSDIAESCYAKILEKYKGADRINYLAAYALSLTYNGKHELSAKVINELKGLKKEWYLPFLIEGWNELLMGNYEKAEKAFLQSDKKGEKLYSSVGRAITFYCNKDYSNSSRLFYHLEENPKYKKLERSPVLLSCEGYSYANILDFNSAMTKFTDYASIVKKNDCYYIGMSLCAFGFNDFNSAEAFLDSAGIQINNLSEYYYLKGVYALRNLKFKDAEASFTKSLTFNNENLWSINGLGAALKGLENFEKSFSVFNEGLKFKPNDPYLLFNKASSVFNIAKKLYGKGANTQANDTLKYGISLMHKVAVIAPGFFTDMNIGNAYAAVKDSVNALKYYNKINNPAADVNIGSLYAGMNMYSNARQMWEQVQATDNSFVLAKYNIEALDAYSGSSKGQRFQYYENFYFQIGYHWDIEIPFLYEHSFEPLVPLGYSNLKFTKISKEEKPK